MSQQPSLGKFQALWTSKMVPVKCNADAQTEESAANPSSSISCRSAAEPYTREKRAANSSSSNSCRSATEPYAREKRGQVSSPVDNQDGPSTDWRDEDVTTTNLGQVSSPVDNQDGPSKDWSCLLYTSPSPRDS